MTAPQRTVTMRLHLRWTAEPGERLDVVFANHSPKKMDETL